MSSEVVAEIITLRVKDETDLVSSRYLAREVAAAVGLAEPDQVRVATALSEVNRDLLDAGGGTAVLSLVDPEQPRLSVELEPDVDSARIDAEAPGVRAAQLLLDSVRLTEPGQPFRVVLEQQVDSPRRRTPDELRAVGRRLMETGRSPADELRAQNQELVRALDEVRTHYTELETTNQGVVALYAELDERSRLLREVSESKTRFLNNISHELRTPGNSVLGLSRLLLDPAADPLTDEQRQQVEYISASAEDLLRLVNELLDLAKAESGRMEPVVEPVDLAALFGELEGTIAPLMTRPEVVLDVRRPEGVDALRTDPSMLRHVLRNLLTNAVKFTAEGSVTMTGAGVDGRLVVQVRDTGVGIAPQDQPRVFEEFYQVRGRLQAQSKGTGLGLPFARRLSILLGGDLRLESGPGEGTTMTVDVPLDGPPSRPEQEATG